MDATLLDLLAPLTDLGTAFRGLFDTVAKGLTDGGTLLAQAAEDKVKSENLGGNAPEDFSLWAIILRADLVVKAVMIMLVLASVYSWAVIFDKWRLVSRINKRADKFEDRFWSGGSVDDLYKSVASKPDSPMATVFVAAMEEWQRSGADIAEARNRPGVVERIERVMNVAVGREMDKIERRTGFLASTGATAPFIGLFGTVWGIMNAFRDIAVQKNTNLSTVAPGISEALFATALGLVAAIPAVVAYNKLTNDFDRYAHRLEGFTSEFGAIVSRQIESGGR